MENKTLEIDLIALIVKLIRLIKRKILFITVIFTLTLLLGLFFHNRKLNPQTILFKRTFIVGSTFISNYVISNYVNALDTRNKFNLSRQLNSSSLIAGKINKITAETITNPDNTSYVNIEIVFSGKDKTQEITNLLLNYLENNRFSKKQYQLELDKNKKMLNLIDSNIRNFRTYKSLDNLMLKDEQFDIKSSNLELFYLNQKKFDLEKKIFELQPIQIFSIGNPVINSSKFSLVNVIILSSVIGLFTSFFLLYLNIVYRRILKYKI